MGGKMVVHMKAKILYLELFRILLLHAAFSVKMVDALNSAASGFGTGFVRELFSEVSHIEM